MYRQELFSIKKEVKEKINEWNENLEISSNYFAAFCSALCKYLLKREDETTLRFSKLFDLFPGDPHLMNANKYFEKLKERLSLFQLINTQVTILFENTLKKYSSTPKSKSNLKEFLQRNPQECSQFDIVNGLAIIQNMVHEEYLVKKRIVESLSLHNLSEAEALYKIWCDDACLNKPKVKLIFQQIDSFAK